MTHASSWLSGNTGWSQAISPAGEEIFNNEVLHTVRFLYAFGKDPRLCSQAWHDDSPSASRPEGLQH